MKFLLKDKEKGKSGKQKDENYVIFFGILCVSVVKKLQKRRAKIFVFALFKCAFVCDTSGGFRFAT